MKYKNFKLIQKNDFKSEKGASLIIIISIIVGLGLIGMIATNLVMSESRVAVIDAAKNKAFYIAETGMEYTIGMLTDSSSWRATSTDVAVGAGFFNVNIIDNTTVPALGDTLFATVTATAPAYVKTVQARLLISDVGSLRHGFCAGTSMWLFGNGSIEGDLHANWIAWVGSNYFYTGDKTTSPDVTMPTIDWNFFKNAAIAAGQYSTNDIHFETADMPITGVWYTTKDFKIDDNNITVNGTLVAEDDLEINKTNFEIYATQANYPALIIGDKFKIDKDNMVIEGLLYAKIIELKDNNHIITGAVMAQQSISHTGGNLTLNLDPAYTRNIAGVTIVDSSMLGPPGLQFMSWTEK